MSPPGAAEIGGPSMFGGGIQLVSIVNGHFLGKPGNFVGKNPAWLPLEGQHRDDGLLSCVVAFQNGVGLL